MKQLDLISEFKSNILVDRDSLFRTSFGGCLTILIAVISALCIFGFGRELYSKNNPIVTTSDYIDSNSLKLDRSIFKTAISPVKTGGELYQDLDKMIEVTSSSLIINPNNEPISSFSHSRAKKCKNSEMKNSFMNDEENYYCLSEKTNNNLEGSYGNSTFSVWIFYVNYCLNTTENNYHCKSREEIQKTMNEIYFQIVFTNFYIDSSDYNTPVKSNYNEIIIRSSATNYRFDAFFFKKFDFFSDNGFILKDKVEQKGFYLERHEFDTIHDNDSQIMIKIVDKFQQKIERNYIKLQKIAADNGGIIKFFSLLFSFLATNYSNLRFYDYLINHLKFQERKTYEKYNHIKSGLFLQTNVSEKENLRNLHQEKEEDEVEKNLNSNLFKKLSSHQQRQSSGKSGQIQKNNFINFMKEDPPNNMLCKTNKGINYNNDFTKLFEITRYEVDLDEYKFKSYYFISQYFKFLNNKN